MKSCAIIISHFESLPFLHTAIRQIKKYAHPEISQKIFVVDQSSEATYNTLITEYGPDPEIILIHTLPLYSGYGLDFLLQRRYIDTDYVAQLHTDSFPIHNNWLHLPISLMEEFNLAFCGQLQFISDGTPHIYPPSPMFAMAQCFNVGRTDVYRDMSFKAGFTRFHNRPYVEEGISWEDTSWADWAEPLYKERGSDDDVVAFSWEDRARQDNKLGLAISGFIQPSFGRIVDDLVFHFGSHREALGVLDKMPELYLHYLNKINVDYSDELISEMVEIAKANKPSPTEILQRNYWNGVTKQTHPPYEEINKRIEELKNS